MREPYLQNVSKSAVAARYPKNSPEQKTALANAKFLYEKLKENAMSPERYKPWKDT